MQAELKGIVNRNQAFEDTLTDEVFSAVSFLPRDVVLASLLETYLPEIPRDAGPLEAAEFLFWPPLDTGKCIPDAVIVVGSWVVVVEAKAGAQFGAGTEPDDHQLVAEWKAAKRYWPESAGVLVLAVTDDVTEPSDVARANAALMSQAGTAPVRWIRWADVAELVATGMDSYRPHEAALAKTLLTFMHHRGVPMFAGFDVAAYRTVVEATNVAAETVYPQMADLASELRTLLERDGWRWANTGGQSVFGWWGNTGFSDASRWGRTYMALLWSPPESVDLGFAVVLCNFLDPTIDVAWIDRNQVTTFDPEFAAEALTKLPADIEVGFHGAADWASSLKDGSRPAPQVTADWITAMRQRRGRLRLRRQLPVDTVDSSEAVAQALRRLISDIAAVSPARTLLLGQPETTAV